jgi:hypothetical protein
MFRYARTSNICGLLYLQDMDIGYQLPENVFFILVQESGKKSIIASPTHYWPRILQLFLHSLQQVEWLAVIWWHLSFTLSRSLWKFCMKADNPLFNH